MASSRAKKAKKASGLRPQASGKKQKKAKAKPKAKPAPKKVKKKAATPKPRREAAVEAVPVGAGA